MTAAVSPASRYSRMGSTSVGTPRRYPRARVSLSATASLRSRTASLRFRDGESPFRDGESPSGAPLL